jgi:ATP-dependent 26S proteasome regulatory subunit
LISITQAEKNGIRIILYIIDEVMSLIIYSNQSECKIVLSYIYDYLKKSQSQDIQGVYVDFDQHHINDYAHKGEKKYMHMIIPMDGKYTLDNITIDIHDYIKNGEAMMVKYRESLYAVKEVIFTAESDSMIKSFIEKCISIKQKEMQDINIILNGKLKKKLYSKYGWINNATIAKRDIGTIFLKEGQIEDIKSQLLEFIHIDTYNDYLKHGIPYKLNILLHGVPGVGKTSLIHCIASVCNADICVLNINEDLKESDMIEAIKSVNDDSKLAIVVIEDIDCIFNDRKNLDSHRNHITLHGLLNCLDGFNNNEGLILILTTNYPDKLDTALTRSGRIDMNIELTYLDRFQAKNMFLSFFDDDKAFDVFWGLINKYDIEPSSLLQFLFKNRKSTDISVHFDTFVKELYKKTQNTCNMYI